MSEFSWPVFSEQDWIWANICTILENRQPDTLHEMEMPQQDTVMISSDVLPCMDQAFSSSTPSLAASVIISHEKLLTTALKFPAAEGPQLELSSYIPF